MHTLKEDLMVWLEMPIRVKWFVYPEFKLYVRKSLRRKNRSEEFIQTFDLATIEVAQPNQGTFTSILPIIEEVAFQKYTQIYVENVIDYWFVDFFERNGYIVVSTDGLSSCLMRQRPKLKYHSTTTIHKDGTFTRIVHGQ